MNMSFSWFPGHMQSTIRTLSREEKMASMALVVLDARCPESSRNRALEEIFQRKPLLFALNKEDMASVRITSQWVDYLTKEGLDVISISCRTGSGRKKLMGKLSAMKEQFESRQKRGRGKGQFRIVVVGVPNSGKSSVINTLSPVKSVKTGKKPGLTRGPQWLKVAEGMEVLDSPGVMMPRMDTEETRWILGAVAAIRQDILPLEQVAGRLVDFLKQRDLFPSDMFPEADRAEDSLEAIGRIAISRGFILKGGEPDYEKASLHFLKIFREGRLGRISLELPPLSRTLSDEKTAL